MSSRAPLVWSGVSAVLAAAPLLLVALAWQRGELPDPDTWFQSANYGPWAEKPEGFILFFSAVGLLLTAIGTVVHGCVAALRRRQLLALPPFLVSGFVSYGLFLLVGQWLWLID